MKIECSCPEESKSNTFVESPIWIEVGLVVVGTCIAIQDGSEEDGNVVGFTKPRESRKERTIF